MRLVVGNSMCRLEGMTPEVYRTLKEELSYSIAPQAAYYQGSHRPQKRYLIDRTGAFPTGLLYLVEKCLAREPVVAQIVDTRKRPEGRHGLFTLSLPYAPYPEQKRAAEAAGLSDRGVIVAPTGMGKSVIAALVVNELQVRTLIVVPTLELKRQLTASLKSAFGASKCGPLSEKRDIAVENVDALDTKKPLTGYDCVIIDEFHHSGAKTYRELNKKCWAGVFYKFGLTATPFRSQDHERLLLESVLSKVIFRMEYQEAVKRGYIVPMEAYYYDLPKRPIEGYTWAQVYAELVTGNHYRNTLIADILGTLVSARVPTLCLVKEIKHGDAIAGASDVAFANGLNENTRELILEFNLQERTALIGTTGVLGEGVDTKPAEYVIIAGLGKSKNAFMQQVGRGFRVYSGKTSCKIILFRDSSHKWGLAHFRAQCKVLLDEYGIRPVKLTYSDK